MSAKTKTLPGLQDLQDFDSILFHFEKCVFQKHQKSQFVKLLGKQVLQVLQVLLNSPKPLKRYAA